MPLWRWPLCGWLPWNTPRTWLGADGSTSGLPTRMLAITSGLLRRFFVIVASRAEHRRMTLFDHLAVAEVHVDAARQARIEAAHRAHDVDALEVVLAVLLEDRQALHRVLVRARRAEAVARARVPRRRRIRMVVRDLLVADHQVMRPH